jgi:hypothetical protein
MTTIKFGTDGWRGIIAEDFTFANARIVAQAIARCPRRGRPTAPRTSPKSSNPSKTKNSNRFCSGRLPKRAL